MRVYTVHRRSAGPFREDDVQLVREGFCWGAAIFGPFWALYRGLWLTALLLVFALAVMLALVAAMGGEPVSSFGIQFGLFLLAGLFGNDLRRWTLTRRGYDFESVVASDSLPRAERRYFNSVGAFS